MNLFSKLLVLIFSLLISTPNALARYESHSFDLKNEYESTTLYGILDAVKPYNVGHPLINNNSDLFGGKYLDHSLGLANSKIHLTETNKLEDFLTNLIISAAIILVGLPILLIGFVISSAIFQRIVFRLTGYVYLNNHWVMLPNQQVA